MTTHKPGDQGLIKSGELFKQQPEELLRLLLEYSPSAIAILDLNLCYLVVSQKWLQSCGLSDPVLLIGQSHCDKFPRLDQEDPAIYERCLAGVSVSGEGELILAPTRLPDWVKWQIYPWHDGKSQVGGLIITIEVGADMHQRSTLSVQQSALYRQVQQLNIDLEHQVHERTSQLRQVLNFEAMLKRITDKVRDSLDENQILQSAVKELTLGLNVGCCNSALYNLDQGASTICYEYTTSMPAYQGRVAQMGDYPEIYDQLLQGNYFQFCSIAPNPHRGRVAMLACPIFDNQGVLGDLWLINHEDYIFKEFEIRLVQQVANQCAIAIRQARLYQAAQAQVQELEKLNRLKDDFLSTVSHELRTPVSNMKMAIHMLRVAPTPDRRERYLEILQAECAREADLINDLLDLQRLEAASYPLSEDVIHLEDWLSTIIEPFIVRTQNFQQQLQIDLAQGLPPIKTHSPSLMRILVELLNNACKYTPAGGQIILAIVAQQPNQPIYRVSRSIHMAETNVDHWPAQFQFTLKNQAQIPPGELPRIFEKFYRIPNSDPWKQGGTGLGLALVQKLVEQLQGDLQVESREGWTTFTLKFLF
ncbi:hypothetical protein BST81_19330 [Leptolyngbya sp. 'hensonii']|uniref:sensor histidine kinase n=1 Tax=Leptolyngbya sp. 'hensonii' TaxID=1922337 RepID=UPI00094FF5FE|nr:PAS domain-containing sensor histidine kinase [Leptolyngbya sp. 'hensonii']OLP16849.1 hypothetical protein BST81_19330 [Leptolyngbya sp. 'hensonii']